MERKPGDALGPNRVILDDAKAKDEHLRESRVRSRYSDPTGSGIECYVKPGPQLFDIPLKSR